LSAVPAYFDAVVPLQDSVQFQGTHDVEPRNSKSRVIIMLRWAFAFFVLALVAGVFGFAGIAASAVGIARILFFLFLLLFVASLVFGRVGKTID
jgi:uncharacterized membrane protein YtjA (UPF0391 family)